MSPKFKEITGRDEAPATVEAHQDLKSREGEEQRSFRERVKGFLGKILTVNREARGFGANIPRSELPSDIVAKEEVMDIVTDNSIDTINNVTRYSRLEDVVGSAAYIDHLDRLANDSDYAKKAEQDEFEMARERKEREIPEFRRIYDVLDGTTDSEMIATLHARLEEERMLQGLTSEQQSAYREKKHNDTIEGMRQQNIRDREEDAREAARPTAAEMDKWEADELFRKMNKEGEIEAKGNEFLRAQREALVDPELKAKFLKSGLTLKLKSGTVDLSDPQTWDKILQPLLANEETMWKAQSLEDGYKSIQKKAGDIMRYGRDGQIHQDVKKEFEQWCREFMSNVSTAIDRAKLNVDQFVDTVDTKEGEA